MTYALAFFHAAVVAVVTAFVWLLPRIDRDTVPFGVRVPPDRAAAPEIADTRRRYGRTVLAVGAATLVSVAALWPLLPAAAAMGSTGALLAVGAAGAYLRAHRVVRSAKDRGDWYAGRRQGAATDTGLRTEPVRVPWWGAVPSLLVIVAVTVIGVVLYPTLPERLVIQVVYREGGTDYTTTAATVGSAFTPVLVQVGLTAVLLLLLRLTMRARADIDPARPRESAERHRRFLRYWGYCLLALTFLQNVAVGGLALLVWTDSIRSAGPAAAAVLAVPMLAGGALVVGLGVLIGQSGWRLRAAAGEATGYVQRDDDRHWHLAGLVYVNRHDPSVFVPKRSAGLGWTVNLGRPAVWIALGLALAALAVLIALGATGSIESTHYGWEFGDTFT